MATSRYCQNSRRKSPSSCGSSTHSSITASLLMAQPCPPNPARFLYPALVMHLFMLQLDASTWHEMQVCLLSKPHTPLLLQFVLLQSNELCPWQDCWRDVVSFEHMNLVSVCIETIGKLDCSKLERVIVYIHDISWFAGCKRGRSFANAGQVQC